MSSYSSTKFSEGKYLTIAMISNLQIFVVGVPVLIILGSDPKTSFFVRSVIVWMNDLVVLSLIFGNLICSVWKDKRDNVDSNVAIQSAMRRYTVRASRPGTNASAHGSYRSSNNKLGDSGSFQVSLRGPKVIPPFSPSLVSLGSASELSDCDEDEENNEKSSCFNNNNNEHQGDEEDMIRRSANCLFPPREPNTLEIQEKSSPQTTNLLLEQPRSFSQQGGRKPLHLSHTLFTSGRHTSNEQDDSHAITERHSCEAIISGHQPLSSLFGWQLPPSSSSEHSNHRAEGDEGEEPLCPETEGIANETNHSTLNDNTPDEIRQSLHSSCSDHSANIEKGVKKNYAQETAADTDDATSETQHTELQNSTSDNILPSPSHKIKKEGDDEPILEPTLLASLEPQWNSKQQIKTT